MLQLPQPLYAMKFIETYANEMAANLQIIPHYESEPLYVSALVKEENKLNN